MQKKLIQIVRDLVTAATRRLQCRCAEPSKHRIINVPLLFTIGFALVPGITYASGTVVVVPARHGGVYQEFIRAFEESLERNKGKKSVAVRIIESKALNKENYSELYSNAQLIVTVGTSAAQKVLEINPPIPVLNTLIPRSSYVLMASGSARGSVSSICLDQPLVRRFALAETILPHKKNIGVVLGPSTRNLESKLQTLASHKGIRVKVETMRSNQRLVGPLNRALEGSDAFLAIADPAVSNRRTVQNLLLTTYRQRVPVIAYSKAYVKAGALAAVYSTPHQIGTHAGEIVGGLVRTGNWSLPKPQFPKYFSVEINDQVAKSLGLRVPKAVDVKERIQRTQGVSP